MAELADNIMGPVENLFNVFGLMDSILARTIVGVALGAITWYVLKPSSTITAEGALKPWTPLAGEGEESTWFPWYFYPLAGGVLFGVFV